MIVLLWIDMGTMTRSLLTIICMQMWQIFMVYVLLLLQLEVPLSIFTKTSLQKGIIWKLRISLFEQGQNLKGKIVCIFSCEHYCISSTKGFTTSGWRYQLSLLLYNSKEKYTTILSHCNIWRFLGRCPNSLYSNFLTLHILHFIFYFFAI